MKTLIKFMVLCNLIFCTQISIAQVTIKKNGISIAPGTKISNADKDAINNILRQYDSSLYQIRSYSNNGKMTSRKGSLATIKTTEKISSSLISGKGNMVAADMTVQASKMDLDNSSDTSKSIDSHSSIPGREREIQRLISQLKVVLSKYQ
ncbi:hypothetical protein [Pedobacter punctiformis]|uniref:Uncharacterized protein n=1 Tax=Pedobacter punctiformis TaxID=3004097 RepID=A0ABT4L8U4_9SPHI|nr:hypothetical protein [Pedobacter sp. HCMS5-2]MCZ4244347.1 hypothetical protein [Pedobacter sp. HCMS5-2]